MTSAPSAPERLIRGKELIGLPVVTMSGDDVAEIRDVVYDPAAGGALVGFSLNRRGFFSGRHQSNLAGAHIAALGRDAVMIADEDSLGADEAADVVVDASADRNVLGSAVVTEDGRRLGVVEDVVLLTGRAPRVEGYVLTADRSERHSESRSVFVPLPEQIAVSGDALIVPSELAGFVADDLAGFGAAVADFRSTHARQVDTVPTSTTNGHRVSEARGRSKAQLYEEATRRGIRGRSSMSKAELERALEETR